MLSSIKVTRIKHQKSNEGKSQNVFVKLIASGQCGNAECVQLSSNSHKIRLKKCLLWILHQICISWARSHLTQLTPTQARLPHSASCAASKTCSSSIRRHLTLEGCFRMTHMFWSTTWEMGRCLFQPLLSYQFQHLYFLDTMSTTWSISLTHRVPCAG